MAAASSPGLSQRQRGASLGRVQKPARPDACSIACRRLTRWSVAAQSPRAVDASSPGDTPGSGKKPSASRTKASGVYNPRQALRCLVRNAVVHDAGSSRTRHGDEGGQIDRTSSEDKEGEEEERRGSGSTWSELAQNGQGQVSGAVRFNDIGKLVERYLGTLCQPFNIDQPRGSATSSKAVMLRRACFGRDEVRTMAEGMDTKGRLQRKVAVLQTSRPKALRLR